MGSSSLFRLNTSSNAAVQLSSFNTIVAVKDKKYLVLKSSNDYKKQIELLQKVLTLLLTNSWSKFQETHSSSLGTFFKFLTLSSSHCIVCLESLLAYLDSQYLPQILCFWEVTVVALPSYRKINASIQSWYSLMTTHYNKNDDNDISKSRCIPLIKVTKLSLSKWML